MNKSSKVILLTGATGKLGTCFIQQYINDYYIIGISRNDSSFTHPNYFHIKEDLGKIGTARNIVTCLLEKFGKIDVLINNAVSYNLESLLKENRNEIQKDFQVNVFSPFELATEIFHRYWKLQSKDENLANHRCIVNISSISGMQPVELTGDYKMHYNYGVYASAKAALNHLTIHMSYDFKEFGIRVNGLAPTTFPEIISTASVAHEIEDYLYNDLNGTIKIIDKDNIYFWTPN